MSIEVRNLTHVYMPGTPFEKKALNDVSFTVGDGEFVGVIGHTGSGKSTLIMHLNGLLRPTSGECFVDGVNLTDKNTSLRDVRRRVGLVFQYPEYQLFEETVLADVKFGPRNVGAGDGEAEASAAEALRQVGLDDETVWQMSPFELSGGQKRRVAIAGVLAMKPNTLIMDEPTAGLDPRGRSEIMTLMRNIHASGVTVIMVSHSMADVASLCGRALVLNGGRLIADDEPRGIFADADLVRRASLGLPPCAQLSAALREAGFDGIPAGMFDRDSLTDAIESALKGGKTA